MRHAEFKAQIAVYLSTLKPGYPKTLDELAARANDPKTGYRSPGKAVGLKYSASVAPGLDDPVYLAAKNEGLAMITSAVLGTFVNVTVSAPAEVAFLYQNPLPPVFVTVVQDPPTESAIPNVTGGEFVAATIAIKKLPFVTGLSRETDPLNAPKSGDHHFF